jgi:hypothetical protein
MQIRLLRHATGLLSWADLGSALGEADLLSRVWIPADRETRTFFSHEA